MNDLEKERLGDLLNGLLRANLWLGDLDALGESERRYRCRFPNVGRKFLAERGVLSGAELALLNLRESSGHLLQGYRYLRATLLASGNFTTTRAGITIQSNLIQELITGKPLEENI